LSKEVKFSRLDLDQLIRRRRRRSKKRRAVILATFNNNNKKMSSLTSDQPRETWTSHYEPVVYDSDSDDDFQDDEPASKNVMSNITVGGAMLIVGAFIVFIAFAAILFHLGVKYQVMKYKQVKRVYNIVNKKASELIYDKTDQPSRRVKVVHGNHTANLKLVKKDSRDDKNAPIIGRYLIRSDADLRDSPTHANRLVYDIIQDGGSEVEQFQEGQEVFIKEVNETKVMDAYHVPLWWLLMVWVCYFGLLIGMAVLLINLVGPILRTY
jgi:hypothetical protein